MFPQIASAQTTSSAHLIADFRAMCLATNSDRDAALAEADKRHWIATDASKYAKGKETYIIARRGDNERGNPLLLVEETHGNQSGAPVRFRSCTVFETVENPRAVIAFAKSLAGNVQPYKSDALGSEWFYVQTDAGPKAVASNQAAIDAARSARFRQLMVSDQQTGFPNGNTALSYVVWVSP